MSGQVTPNCVADYNTCCSKQSVFLEKKNSVQSLKCELYG